MFVVVVDKEDASYIATFNTIEVAAMHLGTQFHWDEESNAWFSEYYSAFQETPIS